LVSFPSCCNLELGFILLLLLLVALVPADSEAADPQSSPVMEETMQKIDQHSFHQLHNGFTSDRTLKKHGIANISDLDWLVRTLAIRDLLRLGPESSSYMARFFEPFQPACSPSVCSSAGIMAARSLC
jgi:hypothetical protein